MPIYEYHCKSCDKDVEVLVFRSGDEIVCPECGGKDLCRLMSGFAHKCDGGPMVSSGGGCSSCSGGSCSTCH